MELLTLIIGIATIILAVYVLRPKKRPKNFPPGPNGVPLFGNAFQVGPQGHKSVIKMAEKYGPILGFRFGSYWLVYLTNLDDIREAYSKPEFSGRWGYNPILEDMVSKQMRGVVMSIDQVWQNERRFCLRTLRDFGLGRRSLEGIIQEETQDLIEQLRQSAGVPFTTHGRFNGNVVNIIWAIVAGKRFPYGDKSLKELLRLLEEIAKNAFSGIKFLYFLFPALVSLRKGIEKINYFHDDNQALRVNFFEFMQKSIDEHRETRQVGNPRDFIDAYLDELDKTGQDSKTNLIADHDDYGLKVTLMDLFGAGSETTSTALTWALFYLATFPKKQEKMFKEIQSVVGSRSVTLEDRQNLPYTEATLWEILRLSSITASGVPHSTTEDVTFKGYHIPKNTIIFANFYGIHYSKEIWGDPENFRPERFLSPDEKIFTKNPNVVPFSVGKRQCLGDILAKDEFYIFLSNMVQQFKIKFPPGEPQHSLEGHVGLVLHPGPHKIVLLDRNI